MERKHLKQYRTCWESDWSPESPRFTSERCRTIKLLYWWVNQRHPSDKNSSLGPHQLGMSIGRASDWHVRKNGLMTRSDKANITTICNRGRCWTISITEGRFDKAIAPRFLNGDVAQMVERSLSVREVRGSMPPASPIFQRSPEIKKGKTVSCFENRKKTWIFTSNMRKEASETVQSLLRKRLVSRITKVHLRKTSEETLLYWWTNQRHPSDINSYFGPHQRGMSIGRASDWHVRNTWIDDPHRQSQYYNDMQ